TWMTAAIGLGSAQLQQGRIEEASQTLEPLQTARDVPPAYWILISQVRLAKQLKLPEADRNWAEIEKALAKAGAKSVEASIVRAGMLVGKGDYATAKTILDKVLTALPPDEKQNAKLALQCAEAVVVQPARDYRDAIWLSRFHQAAGDNAKAETLLQSALEQA